jgi:hypothetical protein
MTCIELNAGHMGQISHTSKICIDSYMTYMTNLTYLVISTS